MMPASKRNTLMIVNASSFSANRRRNRPRHAAFRCLARLGLSSAGDGRTPGAFGQRPAHCPGQAITPLKLPFQPE